MSPAPPLALTGGIPVLTGGIVFLVLSIMSSVTIAVLLRFGESRGVTRLVVIAANYVVATGVSLVLWHGDGWIVPHPGALLLGALTGISFALTFLMLILAIGRVGIAIPVSITRLAVIIPVLASVLAYGESPTSLQMIGLVLALVALGFFGKAALTGQTVHVRLPVRNVLLMIGLFAGMGINELNMKVFKEMFPVDQMHGFLTVLFGTAMVFAWILVWRRRTVVRARDIRLGLALGVPNACASIFLILALDHLPGIVVFPVNDVCIVLLSTLAGILIWREMPTRWGWVGLSLAAGAIALINTVPMA